MDVKIPNGMKSPTVVIVGGGTMTGDEKSNKVQEKRMDLLERKLDQQYKKTTEGKSYSKDIEFIQKSFMKKLDKLITQHREGMSSQNNKLLDALGEIKKLKTDKGDNSNEELKTFIRKIDSLEEAIRKISLKPPSVNISRTVKLDNAFDKLFARLEDTIRKARPRLTPSPS